MPRLILIRHGQTASNVHGLLDTDFPGPGLTELGQRQAEALVNRFAGEPVERIVASPLARTLATAAPLAAATGLEPIQDLRLREILAGDLEMRSGRDAVEQYLRPVLAWARGDLAAQIPGSAEDGAAFFARFDPAIADAVAGASGTVVVVSHGASLRTWAGARSTNLPVDHGADHGLPNAGVVELEGRPGAWRAIAWEDERFESVESDPTGAALP